MYLRIKGKWETSDKPDWLGSSACIEFLGRVWIPHQKTGKNKDHIHIMSQKHVVRRPGSQVICSKMHVGMKHPFSRS